MVPRLHIRQEPGRQRRAVTDSWLASQDRARTAGLVHGPSRAFKSDLAGRFALDRAAGVRCAPKEGDLDVTCAKCGSRRWIGLVYCTQCGQLAEETSDSLVPPTKLVPVYLGPVDLRSGRSRRLFPVCGDLIIDRRDGPAELVTVESDAEGEAHPAQRLIPQRFTAGMLEAVTVGRWIVVRSADHLQAVPAPLLRIGDPNAGFTTIEEGTSAGAPKRSLKAIAVYGSAGASSVARLGTHLVALFGGPAGKTLLRVFDLGVARQAGADVEEVFRSELDGEWLLDRGGWTGSDRLALHSPDRVGFLEATGREVRLTQSQRPSPHQVYPASTVLTDHELLYLGVAGNNESIAYSWEYRRDPRSAPKPVGGVRGRSITGIEPWKENGRRSAVARVDRSFYPYSRAELSFSNAALPDLQISNSPPSSAGAVVYEGESLDHLRVRFADEDLPIPSGVRLEARMEAVEGDRLWLLGAHRQTGEQWLRVYDRRPA